MLFALVLSTTRSERISFVTYKVCANTAQYVFLNCHSCSCRLRQGGIFSSLIHKYKVDFKIEYLLNLHEVTKII